MDVARAIAIAGMALIHFAMVLSSNQMDGPLSWFIDRLSGRPATIFMILAGIGVSLRFARVTTDQKRTEIRWNLAKRGVFFLLFGYVNLVVWPGDILRVYGVAYLFAAWLSTGKDRTLLSTAFAVFSSFTVLIFVVDFETNWDFTTLEYANLWTLTGATMNLFYNGFRAVLPWIGLLFVGMWIGRRDLRSSIVRKRLIVGGFTIWLAAEAISYRLLSAIYPMITDADREDIFAILGTDSLPPMPLFLLSSTGVSIAIIALCVELCERLPKAWYQPLAAAGQLAFTWYIGHIFIVVAAGVITDFAGDFLLKKTYTIAIGFAVVMCAISAVYKRRFRHGPLEWLLRKVAA